MDNEGGMLAASSVCILGMLGMALYGGHQGDAATMWMGVLGVAMGTLGLLVSADGGG